jgi:hypothetical protein
MRSSSNQIKSPQIESRTRVRFGDTAKTREMLPVSDWVPGKATESHPQDDRYIDAASGQSFRSYFFLQVFVMPDLKTWCFAESSFGNEASKTKSGAKLVPSWQTSDKSAISCVFQRFI